MDIPKKLVLIGLDGAIPKSVERFVKEGALPNLEKLIKRGAWFENCLCPIPTITPPNWTTIATGATVGTHGITCFSLNNNGNFMDGVYQAFNSKDVKAEYVWESAERAGKVSAVINYPTAYPLRIKTGYQVSGFLAPAGIRDEHTGAEAERTIIGDDNLFTTETYPDSTQVKFETRNGKQCCLLPFRNRRTNAEFEKQVWFGEVTENGLAVYSDEAKTKLFEELEIGKWSDTIRHIWKSSKGEKSGRFKMKLLKLDKNRKEIKLYVTTIESVGEVCIPAEIAQEISDLPGLASSHGCVHAWVKEWIDDETYLQCEDMNAQWISSAAKYMIEKKNVDIAFLHIHNIDSFNHDQRNAVEGIAVKSQKDIERANYLERESYKLVDRAVGRIADSAGDDAMIVIVSDHGSVAYHKYFRMNEALKRAGLIVTKPREGGLPGEELVVEKSRIIPNRAIYLYVNLKSRSKTGIVDDEDYEKTVEETISALYDYTDEETGRKPVGLALRKEDALMFGLKGDIGDVICCVGSGFGGMSGSVHGCQTPVAVSKLGDMRSLLIMAGPGINENIRLDRVVRLEDIVPTACYLMGLPVPAQCEGGVIYQALKDPSYPMKRVDDIRKKYEQLEKMYK